MRRHDHAASNRFAVQPFPITQPSLDGVPKRMAKIQDGAQARLSFVLTHNKGLDFAAALDSMRHGLRLTCF